MKFAVEIALLKVCKVHSFFLIHTQPPTLFNRLIMAVQIAVNIQRSVDKLNV